MLNKLTRSEQIIAVSAIVLLIASFLPWFSIDIGPFSADANGWDVGFLWAGIPVILGLVMLAHIAITRFSPDTNLPDLPVSWAQVHLGAGALAALLVVLKLLIGEDGVDRSFGLILATLAALGLAYGGYLYYREHQGDVAPSV